MTINLINWEDARAEAEANDNALPFISDLLSEVLEEARHRIARHRPYDPKTSAKMIAEDVLTIADAELKSMKLLLKIDAE